MWDVDDKMQVVVMDFKNWCGMLNIMGAIDVITFPLQNHMVFLMKIIIITRLETTILLLR